MEPLDSGRCPQPGKRRVGLQGFWEVSAREPQAMLRADVSEVLGPRAPSSAIAPRDDPVVAVGNLRTTAPVLVPDKRWCVESLRVKTLRGCVSY